MSYYLRTGDKEAKIDALEKFIASFIVEWRKGTWKYPVKITINVGGDELGDEFSMYINQYTDLENGTS